MNHQINIDEAIAIAKEYHLEAEVTECIKRRLYTKRGYQFLN
jgi:hypothetical protein